MSYTSSTQFYFLDEWLFLAFLEYITAEKWWSEPYIGGNWP
jgi:hypothetical protein